MAGETMTLTELQDRIAKRAWENPEFEAEFMSDPKGAFEKYTGQRLPAELSIHAHYNTPNEIHFVIPQRPASSADELTDDDLERVAGGETVSLIALTIAVTVAGGTIATAIVADQANW